MLSNFNINNFGPFQPDVWGTVSDWAMVGVTFFTLRYLIKTLRSQLEVQTIQQDLAKIENYRYKISIQPYFELEVVPPYNEYLFAKFTCKNAKANSVNIVVTEENPDEIIENVSYDQIVPGLFAHVTTPSFNLEKNITLGYIITFQDIEGHSYTQTSMLFYDKVRHIRVINGMPIEI